MARIPPSKIDQPLLSTLIRRAYGNPLLKILDSRGERIDRDKFGNIFVNCAPCPSVGSTITDKEGIKWTVARLDITEENINNTSSTVIYTYTLSSNDINL